jgi:hypothetical protein
MYNVGDEVTLKVKNILYPKKHLYAQYIPEYKFYKGKIIKSPSWAKDSICITSNNPKVNYHLIDSSLVEGMQESIKQVKEQPKTESWTVKGTKGKYTVTNNKNSWSCTCPAFQFRHTCKHISFVQENTNK